MATPSQHPHRPVRRPRTVMHDQRMSVLTPREQVELEAGRPAESADSGGAGAGRGALLGHPILIRSRPSVPQVEPALRIILHADGHGFLEARYRVAH